MLSDVLEITSYATHMQQECNKYVNDMYRTFSEKSGNVLSCYIRLIASTKAYMNVVTKEKYSIESIQEEIKPENRIGTLEQLEQGIVAAEEMVKEMERTRLRER